MLPPLRFNGLAYPGHFVASEVIGHDDVAGRQGGGEKLFDPGRKCRSINGPFQHQRRDDPVVARPGEEGGVCQCPCGTRPITRTPRIDIAASWLGGAVPPFIEVAHARAY